MSTNNTGKMCFSNFQVHVVFDFDMCRTPAVGICAMHRLRGFSLFLLHAAGMSNEGSMPMLYGAQRTRRAKMQSVRGCLVAGGCSAS